MDILHAMSDALMKYETLDRHQIDDLMNRKEVRKPDNWDQDKNSGKPSGTATVDKDVESKTEEANKPQVGGPAEEL